jgi:hypothetical protein
MLDKFVFKISKNWCFFYKENISMFENYKRDVQWPNCPPFVATQPNTLECLHITLRAFLPHQTPALTILGSQARTTCHGLRFPSSRQTSSLCECCGPRLSRVHPRSATAAASVGATSKSLSVAVSERRSVAVSDRDSGPVTVTPSAPTTHATSRLRARRGFDPKTIEVTLTLTIRFLNFMIVR